MGSMKKVTNKENEIFHKMLKSKIRSKIKEEGDQAFDIKLESSAAYQDSLRIMEELYQEALGELDEKGRIVLEKIMAEHYQMMDIIKKNCIELMSSL